MSAPGPAQLTRDNHFVPQWYQRGFLAKGQHKLHVRKLAPMRFVLPNGEQRAEEEVEELGPKRAFCERDLYTTRFGEMLNDEIETYLFGAIDKQGADAVRAWAAGDKVRMHRTFEALFVYLDAQKLRTPKGLDWILKHYGRLPQTELMRQMQTLRLMHGAMWSECVREVVSAAKSAVKFLVSDHPVTVFHPRLPPGAAECEYPGDPGIELVGSQTIFALDANHCLILTNIEYAEDPSTPAILSRRTNARFRGSSLARTDAVIRGRELSSDEVHAVNLVLRSRASKFLGASDPAWLHPERHCTLAWEDIGTILLPKTDLWRFGGEMYIGYEDGTTAYRDKFGRTTKAHEYLSKDATGEVPGEDAPCGCGSGFAFGQCCSGVAMHRRPSWNVLSIRERNIALLRGIYDILHLKVGRTWKDVRRELSNEQVRELHQLFAALWPVDTRLIELLPIPQRRRSRAVYLGAVDARTLAKPLGMLAHVDELLLVHPLVNAHSVKPEFSPVDRPAQFREQTLRSVLSLLTLESGIRSGRVHLVPDPLDYDAGFRSEIMAIADGPVKRTRLGPFDKQLAKALARDEHLRAIKRMPHDELKAYLRQMKLHGASAPSEEVLDGIVQQWKLDNEQDPLALFDPLPKSADGGEFKVFKGFSRETGLFVATLTGAFVFTDSDTQWARLHEPDRLHRYEPDPDAEGARQALSRFSVDLAVGDRDLTDDSQQAEGGRSTVRAITLAVQAGQANGIERPAPESLGQEESSSPEGDVLKFSWIASVPREGFVRTDVSRLLLTFGRIDAVPPVRLAVFLQPPTEAAEPRMPVG